MSLFVCSFLLLLMLVLMALWYSWVVGVVVGDAAVSIVRLGGGDGRKGRAHRQPGLGRSLICCLLFALWRCFLLVLKCCCCCCCSNKGDTGAACVWCACAAPACACGG